MPWSLSVCSCDIAPPLPVFPWLEFPSQLPVVQMNAVWEFAVFFQDPYDKISAGAPEEDWSPWGSQHRPFSSVQPGMGGVGVPWGWGGMGGVGVPWGWGGESSCLSQGGRGPVACLPGQGFQPAVRNQWCQWNLPAPMKSCISSDAKPFQAILICGQEGCPLGSETLRRLPRLWLICAGIYQMKQSPFSFQGLISIGGRGFPKCLL